VSDGAVKLPVIDTTPRRRQIERNPISGRRITGRRLYLLNGLRQFVPVANNSYRICDDERRPYVAAEREYPQRERQRERLAAEARANSDDIRLVRTLLFDLYRAQRSLPRRRVRRN